MDTADRAIIKKVKQDMDQIKFVPKTPDFNDTWPAWIEIKNRDYEIVLLYAGTGENGDHPNAGEYPADKAAGKLSRKNLSLKCRPTDPERAVNLTILSGYVFMTINRTDGLLDGKDASRLANDLLSAKESAAALDAFITERFGPAE